MNEHDSYGGLNAVEHVPPVPLTYRTKSKAERVRELLASLPDDCGIMPATALDADEIAVTKKAATTEIAVTITENGTTLHGSEWGTPADLPGDRLEGNNAMRPSCMDLRQLFGDKYRLAVEESYYAERPQFRKQEEPWLTFIVCRYGQIGVWGGNLLVASTRGLGSVAIRLKALPFAQVVQDGSDGVNVTFALEHFDAVAEIMKPRKRRPKLSREHKAKLMEANAKFRFQPASGDAPEAQDCEVRRPLV